MAPTKPGKTDESETDFERLVQMMENISKQVVDSDTRSKLVERRLADLEAAKQHDEASVNGEERNHDRQRYDRRNDRDAERHNFHRGYEQDPDETVMRSVKVDTPNFDGELNPKALLDWLATMDCYFEWHDMSEARRVRFAKIKLVGQARLFWTNVETQLKGAGEEPIIHWGEIKERWKQKYLPLSYQQSLLDEWQTLRQDDMPVAEYIAKFEEFMLRCDIREDRRMTISQFRSGLRPELQRELIPHTMKTLERVFQMVQELEKYLKSSNVVKQTDSQISDCHVGTSVTPSSTTPTSTTNLVKTAKGKGVLVDTQMPRKETEDWRRTSIFHTYIKSGDKDKVVIDNGSCINVVSTLTVSRLDHVWCDVVDMDVSHILLGRPWIYDYNVIILGQENICSFIHKGKMITMKPFQPKLMNQSIPNKEEQDKVGKTKALHIITLKECKEDAEVPSQVKVRPDSHSTWITKENLPHIDPDVLECYYSFISPESRSFQPGGIDVDIIS
ncbi:unnamed protein product [Prunus armeniaca]